MSDVLRDAPLKKKSNAKLLKTTTYIIKLHTYLYIKTLNKNPIILNQNFYSKI